jgi:hypothetical protein
VLAMISGVISVMLCEFRILELPLTPNTVSRENKRVYAVKSMFFKSPAHKLSVNGIEL